MSSRRINPYKVKLHYSYTVPALAACLGVHKNTIRNWRHEGLEPIDKCRPALFQGGTVRDFLLKRNARRKQPCLPGTIYCFRCRQPRKPALGMVDYIPMRPESGNLRAICECCEGTMHRRIRKADIERVMPGCTVQIAEGQPSIIGKTDPSPNCDPERSA